MVVCHTPGVQLESQGVRNRKRKEEKEESDRIVSPEEIDAQVDDRLKYAKGTAADFLKIIKKWFGTESTEVFYGELGHDRRPQQLTGHPAAERDTYDKYEDVLDRIERYGKGQEHGFRQNWDLFWWRCRNQGLSEEQARTIWNQIQQEKQLYAPLSNPTVELGLLLTSAVGAFAALRYAMSEKVAAEAAGSSRLATLWHRVIDYLKDAGAAAGQVPTAASQAPKVRATISRTKHPEAASHIEDAQATGQPSVLTIDRAAAKARGRQALRDHPIRPGKDRDEYPPKMFEEGGEGASVRPISPADNRGAGASMGNQLRKHPNGTKVKIDVGD